MVHAMNMPRVAFLHIRQYPMHCYGGIYYIGRRYAVKRVLTKSTARQLNIYDNQDSYAEGNTTERFYTVRELKQCAAKNFKVHQDVRVLLVGVPDSNPQYMLACNNSDILVRCNDLYNTFEKLCKVDFCCFATPKHLAKVAEITTEWDRIFNELHSKG